MPNYIKTFDQFLKEQKSESYEEVKVSFKGFLKFVESNDALESSSGNDVTITLKNECSLDSIEAESIKKIQLNEENWDALTKSEYNFFRKKDIYTFEEYLDFAKEVYKNKIS